MDSIPLVNWKIFLDTTVPEDEDDVSDNSNDIDSSVNTKKCKKSTKNIKNSLSKGVKSLLTKSNASASNAAQASNGTMDIDDNDLDSKRAVGGLKSNCDKKKYNKRERRASSDTLSTYVSMDSETHNGKDEQSDSDSDNSDMDTDETFMKDSNQPTTSQKSSVLEKAKKLLPSRKRKSIENGKSFIGHNSFLKIFQCWTQFFWQNHKKCH